MIRQGAAVIAALLLAGCGGQRTQQSASPAPVQRPDLRLAFRTSFLRSCESGVTGQAGQLYCACTEERLEAAYSDEQLAKVTPKDEKFRQIAHACAQLAGLSIRPGH